ncbi:MAG: hypothetical protein HOK89_07465 [Rhodospirillaceae bacterium]|nr:hypothetical protein [Rhodospirillaceae bacterium]
MNSILSFLSVRTIPLLSWSSPKPLNFFPKMATLGYLLLGLLLFGLGEAILIAAGAGVSPWTVLAQGVTNHTDWSIGFSTFIISGSILFLWIPLKQIPGMGTILNVIIIAAVIEFALHYLPVTEDSFAQFLYGLVGVLTTGIGGGIYLTANLGAGPRDGLMTGLQCLTGAPVAWVRNGIELSAVLIGWSLGGVVGVGTLLFAFLIGPSVAFSLFVLSKLVSDRGPGASI